MKNENYQMTFGEHVLNIKDQLVKEGMTTKEVSKLAFAINGLTNLNKQK